MKGRTTRRDVIGRMLLLAEEDLKRLFEQVGLPFDDRGTICVGVWEPGLEYQERFRYLARGSQLVIGYTISEDRGIKETVQGGDG